jgi:propionyl-CoA synthetase
MAMAIKWFIYDSPVTQTIENTLFRSKTEVAKLAGGMQSLGLKREIQQ